MPVLIARSGCIALAVVSLLAMRWPAADLQKRQISSTFGESRLDHFHTGVDLPGEKFAVYPVEDGRIIWRSHGRIVEGEIPFGGGRTLVLDHGKTVSGYMHLQSFSEKTLNGTHLLKTEILGSSGNTGHSGGAHLHFYLYDEAAAAFLNPLEKLPASELFYSDEKSPEFLQLAVNLPDKPAQVSPEKPFTMKSDYPLLAMLQDRGRGYERWGIYEMTLFRGEKPVRHLKFDRIRFAAGRWQLPGAGNFDAVFRGNFYSLGTGFKKDANLKITARGFKGPGMTLEKNLQILDR